MTDKKDGKNWGGKRQGAGRKHSETKSVMVRMTADQHEKFKELGGSAWLQATIEKENRK